MSAAACPKCGVAVVPGYVKCPKCHAPLASGKRGVASGGTVAAGGRTPVLPFVVGGAVAIGIVAFFALRKDSKAAAPPPETDPQVDPQAQQAQQPVATPDPAATLPPDPTPVAAAPDPTSAVNALSRALTKQRLWSTVEAVGDRVDVRSGACKDAGMGPVLDANVAALHDVGLTKLRCLEQSGAVVFERDL